MAIGPVKKDLVFLAGVKSPPLTEKSRRDAGFFLNRVQDGEMLTLPTSRPMPSIGPRIYELRLSDDSGDWRVVYRINAEEIILVEVFKKTTQETLKQVITSCKRRLSGFDAL